MALITNRPLSVEDRDTLDLRIERMVEALNAAKDYDDRGQLNFVAAALREAQKQLDLAVAIIEADAEAALRGE